MEMEFQFNMCFLSKIGLLKQKLDQDNSSQRPELQLNYYYFFIKKKDLNPNDGCVIGQAKEQSKMQRPKWTPQI